MRRLGLVLALLLWLGPNMATIWTDDFESGDPITDHYSLSPGGHCKTDATCGRGGGWGVLSDIKTYHPSYDEYGDYFVYRGADAVESEYYRIEFDTDWSYLSQGEDGVFLEMVGIWSGNWRYLNLDHASGALGNPGLELTISNDVVGSDFVVGVAAAAITPASWQRVMVEVQFSTWTGATPNADGWAKVWVDGACVISGTGLTLLSKAYGQTFADVNKIGRADLFTLGAYDNLLLTTDPLPSAVWVDVPNFKREWIDASRFPGGAARCLCMLWATEAGVNVQARLVSLLADGVTVDAVVGTSADITAVVPTDATFAVALTGTKRHKLQLTSSTPLTDLWCAPGAKVMA